MNMNTVHFQNFGPVTFLDSCDYEPEKKGRLLHIWNAHVRHLSLTTKSVCFLSIKTHMKTDIIINNKETKVKEDYVDQN